MIRCGCNTRGRGRFACPAYVYSHFCRPDKALAAIRQNAR
ncbi:hypothetical protein CIT292_10216 [Citrobacter youngae ATCC 29220]|uniref:Uncharacterized protein n=1 Tax=Citrobacter youngae ATCC 29220 TaxID=500640 RepID=D4BI52_9ENTR|nr:hypothetical protein CIT292_10216 [Citrobacter youngae ATCC 29220]